MWKRKHTQKIMGVTQKEVWAAISNIEAWPQWHKDLDYCKLNGPFKVGSTFMLKPQGQKAVKIELIAVQEGESFTDCTQFPGAKMYDTHLIKSLEGGGVELTNSLEMKGPLAFIWYFLIGKHVAATVSDEIHALENHLREGNRA